MRYDRRVQQNSVEATSLVLATSSTYLCSSVVPPLGRARLLLYG